MRLGGPVLVVVAFVGAFVGACREETIVLATAPGEGDAGTPHLFKGCFQSDDCSQGDYCRKNDCKTSTPGKCLPRPIFCDYDDPDDLRAVCGCSGISYVNDCLRRQAGEESSTQHECDEGVVRTCNGTTNLCPSGAVCERIGGGNPSELACGKDPETQGRCWGIAVCPPSGDHSWTECARGRSDGLKCVDGCTAVQSGRPFTRADPTRDCP